MPHDLQHLRVLVVEDEYFIAQDITNALSALGAEIVGPVGSIDDALDRLRRDPPDLAVLDINLQGELGFVVAHKAAEQGVPFLFATGYEPAVLPQDLQSVPVWRKPFDTDALAAALAALPRGPAGAG